jgi:hypothetical protein
MPIPNVYQQIATPAQVVVICHGEPGKSWQKFCAPIQLDNSTKHASNPRFKSWKSSRLKTPCAKRHLKFNWKMAPNCQ